MHVIKARNVNDAYLDGLHYLRTFGIGEDSRNGKVLVAPMPVTTVYRQPWERVLFDAQRDCNPFFHLLESLWMLAGSDEVDFLLKYNTNMASFSDDGKILNAAYGYRWRKYFGQDQLALVVEMLRKDHTTRRVVLGMWDAHTDLDGDSLDLPCNTHCYFRIRKEVLDMTILCRSNDMVWGAYGANAVHFSILQEYLARAVGVPMGNMYQVSNNFHIYDKHFHLLHNPELVEDPYLRVSAYPLFSMGASGADTSFILDCEDMVRGERHSFRTNFFRHIVRPTMDSWDCYKEGDLVGAQALLIAEMSPCDWQVAMSHWFNRRLAKKGVSDGSK